MDEHSSDIRELRDAIRHLDQKLDLRSDTLDCKIDRLWDEVSSQFRWMVGLQITTMLVVLGAMLGVILTR